MPRELGIDARFDPVFRIGAAVEVLGKELLALAMRDKIIEQKIELGGRKLAVLFPPHRLLGLLVADDELVLGATAGMNAGLRAQRATVYELRLAVGDGVFVEQRFREIPVNRGQISEAELIGAMGTVPQTRFLHG